ncbi:MAG: VOC family protein, partial [Gammaproteobacteria bacterium]|nr:VOC family protein [Gammaproteobacteria bacterium]
LKEQGVKMLMAPKTHRDGARSFYCEDPDGTRVQFIHHQPIAASDQLSKGR